MSTYPDLKFDAPTWELERDPEYNLLLEPGRVYRGGSWSRTADGARDADSYGNPSTSRSGSLGFRLVRDIMSPEVAK